LAFQIRTDENRQRGYSACYDGFFLLPCRKPKIEKTMSRKYVLGNSEAGARELFPEKRIRQVQLGETKICVVRIGEAFFAFEALCPHRLASLSEGTITSFGEIVCPLHHYRFDVKTGAIQSGDCRDMRCYPTEITSSGLVINL
jgi:nitrite reductase/ring-hydroxylating ferredoxin subunit